MGCQLRPSLRALQPRTELFYTTALFEEEFRNPRLRGRSRAEQGRGRRGAPRAAPRYAGGGHVTARLLPRSLRRGSSGRRGAGQQSRPPTPGSRRGSGTGGQAPSLPSPLLSPQVPSRDEWSRTVPGTAAASRLKRPPLAAGADSERYGQGASPSPPRPAPPGRPLTAPRAAGPGVAPAAGGAPAGRRRPAPAAPCLGALLPPALGPTCCGAAAGRDAAAQQAAGRLGGPGGAASGLLGPGAAAAIKGRGRSGAALRYRGGRTAGECGRGEPRHLAGAAPPSLHRLILRRRLLTKPCEPVGAPAAGPRRAPAWLLPRR